MKTSFEEFDGPRMIRREEIIASDRLFRTCFNMPEANNEADLLASYAPPRRGGTYIMAHGGKPVSQIGIFHDQLKMYDEMIRTGSIGGVCTHPAYRKQGLASHLLEHCTQQLVNEGACLMLISGDEGVYMRLGNVFQGKYLYFSIKPGHSAQWRSTPTDLVLRRANEADALLCSQLYQAEPVHFERQKSDFLAALHEPMINTYIHADQWIVERAGQAVAYLFLGIPYHLMNDPSAGVRLVGEYAGSRVALADALHVVMNTGHLKEMTLPVAWQDVELIQSLQDGGQIGNMASLEGYTLRIINFPRFMEDLRPLMRARLGAKVLRGLRFEQTGPILGGIGNDRYTIVRGTDRLELDGAAMTRLIMGDANSDPNSIQMPETITEVISALFPLPSFLPGLNYH